MKTKQINILGTTYTVAILKETEDYKLEHGNGYCDASVRKIVCNEIKAGTADTPFDMTDPCL